MNARRLAAVASVCALAACESSPRPSETRGTSAQRFESHEAVLVEFELEGRVVVPTAEGVRAAAHVEAQLAYTVGQLYGDRSAPRLPGVELAVELVDHRAAEAEVTYRARVPVAWGNGPVPERYTFVLPARMGGGAENRFAEAYAARCSDPAGGDVDAARLFLFYRPDRSGCALAEEDIVRIEARVTLSSANTSGKYPEYQRVWEDDALDVVAVFGREYPASPPREDGGVTAHAHFLDTTRGYLRSIGASAIESATTEGPAGAATRLAARLADGRGVRIEVLLAPPEIPDERGAFDDWFEARTPAADLVVYSGHAGLGRNVRALARKGSFVPRKYLIWVVNGCDTLSYLDSTLAERRALLNPDDPAGTRWMDTVTNVLGGWFLSGDDTTLHLVRALVAGGTGAPQTYEEIFRGIDPEQVIVVTGEEDNASETALLPAPPAPVVAATSPPDEPEAIPIEPEVEPRVETIGGGRGEGCTIGRSADLTFTTLVPLVVAALARRRSRAKRTFTSM